MPCFLGKPFQHDLFVSYSHGAFPGSHKPQLKVWSEKFAEDLREELAILDGFSKVSLFLDDGKRSDENVDRAEKLTDFLRTRVTGSALFALLMTPQYLDSKWCRQELEWWCEKHHPDTLGAGARVHPCWVLPSDEARWHEAIKDVAGHCCYDRDEDQAEARPFAWRGAKDDRYGKVLTAIAGAMARRLRDLKEILDERRCQEEQRNKIASGGAEILFLHGRPDAAAAWHRACDNLGDAGFSVVPDRPVPIASDGGLGPEYRAQLVNSDGVLLLGAEDGPAIDTDIIVIGRNFRNLAAASKPFLPCAVLNIAGEPLRTARRLKNVNNLRMGWIDSTVNDWPMRVRSWLLEAGAQMESSAQMEPVA
jgi:hypothetical protein